MVERAGVYDRLRRLIAAEDHQQVGDHGCFPLVVQFHDVLLLEPFKGELDHAHRAFNYPLSRCNHRARLLTSEHRLSDLRRIGQAGDSRLDDFYSGRGYPRCDLR